MTRQLAVLPFCSPDCRDRAGLLEDADGNVVGKCGCRSNPSPEAARDAALNATAAAHPAALKAACLIIRDAAQTSGVVSANLVRERFDLADIPGPVRAAAFRRAVAQGWIAGTAEQEPSTDVGTHGKPVARYSSLICRGGAA